MLTINVSLNEGLNEETQEFVDLEVFSLELEHSLATISKWESIWEVPFLESSEKTLEQTLSYVRCMTKTPNTPAEVYDKLSVDNINEINDLINAKKTATWFADTGKARVKREVITSELIYYWMVALNIPFECESWHLNRLLTLIQVCNIKNSPDKKIDKKEYADRRRAINDSRKKQLNTNG